MIIIASAAYYEVCEQCGRHACIVFADKTRSRPVVSLRGALSLLLESRREGKLSADEMPELERTINGFRHQGSSEDDEVLRKFFSEHPDYSYDDFILDNFHDPGNAIKRALERAVKTHEESMLRVGTKNSAGEIIIPMKPRKILH